MARPTRQFTVGESVPFPSVSALYNNPSNNLGDMPERRRTHSLWRSAISATKGLFSASSTANSVQQDEYKALLEQLPSPSAFTHSFGDKQSISHTITKRDSISQSIRKCRSTPTLKDVSSNAQVKATTSGTAATSTPHETELPPPLPSSHAATMTRRPLISSPTQSHRMESFDIQSFANNHNNDLIPNEFGSINDCRFASNTSVMKCNASGGGEVYVSSRCGNNLAKSSRAMFRSNSERRRTESAPGLNASNNFLHPGKKIPPKVKRAISRPQLRPSPSFSSTSSQNSTSVVSPPPVLSPKTTYSAAGSPAHSISSVKRKPVPRLLDSVDYDSPAQTSSSSSQDLSALRTPLLSSTDLIMGALNSRSSPKDITLMPIGPSATKTQTGSIGGNISDEVPGTLEVPPVLPSIEELTHVTQGLTPPPPRPLKHTMDTPPSLRTGALSPLTIDDLDAMRVFLSQHEAGNVARQHRKKSLPTDDDQYDDLHTEILQSYLNVDISPLSDDSSSHGASSSFMRDDDVDEDGEEDRRSLLTIATRDDPEVETPVSAVSGIDVDDSHIHRGTFGCYGLGMAIAMEQDPEQQSYIVGDESHYQGMSYVPGQSLYSDKQQLNHDGDYIEGPDPDYTFPGVTDESPVTAVSSISEHNKRYTLLDARLAPQVLVVPPRKSSLPVTGSSPRNLIGRPIAQLNFHEGNSDSMGNIDPDLESMTSTPYNPISETVLSSIDSLHESVAKFKKHSPSLTSTPSFLDSSLPIFKHTNYSSEFELDDPVAADAHNVYIYNAYANDYPKSPQHRKFNHIHYSDSSSTEDFKGGTVTPPLAMSSFMNVSPEEAPSPVRKWPRKTHKRLRNLFTRAAVQHTTGRAIESH